MKTRRVGNINNFLSPTSPHWAQVDTAKISMTPTPLAMQPSDYIRKSWEKRSYGELSSLTIASVHDGKKWALYASWEGSGPGIHEFQDSLAVALPVSNNPVLALMGGKNAPIHMLRWIAGKDEVQSILTRGIGTSEPGPILDYSVQAVQDGQIRHVVITRPLGVTKDVAPLEAGKKTGVGFAVWRGANEERAGLKAFSMDWTELVLDA